MYFSIYLHQPIADTLRCYGNLDDVVNRILSLGDEGAIDIMNKPVPPDREGAIRFDVNVTNESYIKLLDTFSPKSSHISLRRLLYWFAENEIYNEVGWTVVNNLVDAKREKTLRKIRKMKAEAERLRLTLEAEPRYYIDNVIKSLNAMEKTV